MELLCLPNELLLKIISFLDGKDVLELSLVNLLLNELCKNHAIWYRIVRWHLKTKPAFYDFSLDSLHSMTWKSLKSFFVNILQKWGWLLGTWRRNIPAFGGMLFVKLELDHNRIIAYDVQGLQMVLHLVPVFELTFDDRFKIKKKARCILYSRTDHDVSISSDSKNLESGRFKIKKKARCILYSRTDHDISVSSDSKNLELGLQISCLAGDMHKDHDIIQMKNDLAETVGRNNVKITNAVFARYKKSALSFSQLTIPPVVKDKNLVEPGFFLGDYSAHGTEILLLKYGVEDNVQLEKISGDRNVRCGATSVDIDLNRQVDYIRVLKYIVENPHDFNVKDVIQRFPMENNCSWRDDITTSSLYHVEKSLAAALSRAYPNFDLGVDKNNKTFVAAFKGNITLGGMPEAVVPKYFFYEVLVVITNADKLLILWPALGESRRGINLVERMVFNRICF